MNVPHGKKASSVSASTIPAGGRTIAPLVTATVSSPVRRWRRNCASSLSNNAADHAAERSAEGERDLPFLLLLTVLGAVSLPSLAFCFAALSLGVHGIFSGGPLTFHLPPETAWDGVFAMQTSLLGWIARWNWLATLAATALFVATLVRPRWRRQAVLAFIPYAILLCADFTLRWRSALLP